MRIYLDFDGVVHKQDDEWHKIVHQFSIMGFEFYEKYPEHTKIVNINGNGHYILWLQDYFGKADLISKCLEQSDRNIEIYIHSNWRNNSDLVEAVLKETSLWKYYKGCLSPWDYDTKEYRLVNILKHMKNTDYKGKWIAIDDMDDLFYLIPNHFIKCNAKEAFGEKEAEDLIKKLRFDGIVYND